MSQRLTYLKAQQSLFILFSKTPLLCVSHLLVALSFTESPVHGRVFYYPPSICQVLLLQVKWMQIICICIPVLLLTSWLTLTVYLAFVGFYFLMCKMEILVHLGFL